MLNFSPPRLGDSMNNTILIYRPIAGLEGKYSVSATGIVFDLVKDRFCRLYYDNRGYTRVSIKYNDGYKTPFVHRLVAAAWIPNPFNLPVVNHLDNNRLNNCIDNLEWTTQSGNCLDYYRRQRYMSK